MNPETQYVAVGDADVAYQVVGDGPRDMVYFAGLGSHVELMWDPAAYGDFLGRLAAFARLIVFDRRGSGASDGVSRKAIPTWEECTEDVVAVLNAAGSERTSVLGAVDGGPIAILFAAMHPDRVDALVLFNTTCRFMVDDDYPIGASPEATAVLVELLAAAWGTPEFNYLGSPSLARDYELSRYMAKMFRSSATPRTAAAQYDYLLRSMDVRQALPLVQCPTLVLHVADSPILPIDHGRYLAKHIEGARFVELPGGDLGVTPANSIAADEAAEFLTGERPVLEIGRILTTVLFTDIVASTERAVSVGDHQWRALLERHNDAVRRVLNRFRGREIDTAGDGFLATFDGPARAIRCAEAIREAVGKIGIDIRAGLHTGEVELRDDGVAGIAVHIGARVAAKAAPGEVLVSRTVVDLVAGSGIEFDQRGEHHLKGVPGTWSLFAVAG